MSILPALAVDGGAVSPDRAPRLALMIGVDSYNRGWPRKQNAVRDAKLVASEFLRHGYKVAFLENPDSRRLNRALKEFFLIDGENPQSQLFVWYSGHVHTIGGRSFFVPTDAPLPRREAEFTSLSFALDDYVDLLRRAPASQVYTVIDAPVAALDFETRPVAMRDPFAVDLPVRQFLTSAAVGQTTADDGAFRRLFLRGLAGINRADGNLDKLLTADEIGAYMANRISALTKNRQTPLFGRLSGREFAGGDYAFRVGPSHRTDIFAMRARANGDVDEVEQVLWNSIAASIDPRKFESYLKIFPDGANAEKAYARLTEVRRSQDRAIASLAGEPPPGLAPAPPAQPVAKVAAATLQPVREPAFEEMAVPAPPSGGPTQLIPRNLDPGPVPRRLPAAAQTPTVMSPPVIHVRPSSSSRTPPTLPSLSVPSVPVVGPPPRPAEQASPAGSSAKVVQIGAFRARAMAERALAGWQGAVPEVFAHAAAPNIAAADLGPKGIYYRIRIGGFADSRKAGEFCAAFRGEGRDCYVVAQP